MNDINSAIHDIRKPLNNISMQAELIKMVLEAEGDLSKLEASADKIISNAKLCSVMLQTLHEQLGNIASLTPPKFER